MLSTLTNYPDNPRTIGEAEFKRLCESITRDPELLAHNQIVVDEAGVILCGNMRVRALRHLGYMEIPEDWVHVAAGLSEEKRRRLVLLDNSPEGISGDWDWDVLANAWDDLDLLTLGFEVPDVEEPDAGEGGDAEPQTSRAEELNEHWQVKRGDLWRIGPHRLMCGDSTKEEDVTQVMGGKIADTVLTDPPYGVDYTGKTKDALKIENDGGDEAALSALIAGSFDQAQRISRQGAYWFATVPAGPLHLLFASDWKARGILRQVLVWVKNSMVLGHSEYHYQHEPILFGWVPGGTRHKNDDRTRTSVWEVDRPTRSEEHPTMKPVELWQMAMRDGSRNGEIVYDCFLGSGTTMVAAQNLGRVCYGLEISPEYCAVILQRMVDAFPDIDIRKADTT